jgi:hypothetical protein
MKCRFGLSDSLAHTIPIFGHYCPQTMAQMPWRLPARAGNLQLRGHRPCAADESLESLKNDAH